MQDIGMSLVNERKAEVSRNAGGDQKLRQSRDLLSILVKANMSSSPRDKLSDVDLLGRAYIMYTACSSLTLSLQKSLHSCSLDRIRPPPSLRGLCINYVFINLFKISYARNVARSRSQLVAQGMHPSRQTTSPLSTSYLY
jgi:hypothetical protein